MGSSGPGPTLPPRAGDSETERVLAGREQMQPGPGRRVPVQPSYQPASGVVRYGPGVPGSQAWRPAAESVWRTGHRPGPPPRAGQAATRRRLLGVGADR